MKKIFLVVIFSFLDTGLLCAFEKNLSYNLHKETASLLKADSIVTDHELGLIKARGNVEIYRDDCKLKADLVSYDQHTDIITASGNVVLIEASGEEIFSNYLELSGDLKEGLIKEIRIIMADDAKFAAATAKRESNKIQVERAVYSPCSLCRTQSDSSPLWQLKSLTALWDTETHDITYTDVIMELFGIPVFYTPYFSHPDPTIKRRNGFLIPTVGASPSLGSFLNIPYYIILSEHNDLTLKPLFTLKGGEFLGGEYRQHLKNGKFEFAGSLGQSKKIVNADNDQRRTRTRWHIDEKFNLNINEDWRGGIDIVQASDQTYLKQYPFYGHTTENLLKSKFFSEGFYNRNYVLVDGFAFQGLRAGDTHKTTPLILPQVNLHVLTNPQFGGSRWAFDGNFLSLMRQQGTDVQRLSSKCSWQIPYLSPFGDVYALDLSVRGDFYHTDHFIPLNNSKEIQVTTGRLFPQAMLDWHYPFLKRYQSHNIIVAPTVTFVGSPKLKKQKKIPNEDCFILEPNDLSLMQANRFPGLDIIDDGSRVDYGLKTTTSIDDFGNGSVFLGQSHTFQRPPEILKGTGFERKTSDYLGKVEFYLGSYIDLRYRFRLNQEDFSARRNELNVGIGKPILRVELDYIKLPRFLGEIDNIGSEQITINANSQFTNFWAASLSTTRELGKQSRSLAHALGLSYTDECFKFEARITKSFYRDRDLKPGTGFLFRIVFSTLGGVRHSSMIGQRDYLKSSNPLNKK